MPSSSTAKGTGGAVWPRVLDAPAADTQKSRLSKRSLRGRCCLLGPCLPARPFFSPFPRLSLLLGPLEDMASPTLHPQQTGCSKREADMVCECAFLGLPSPLIQTLAGGPRSLHFDPRWFGFTLKLSNPGLGFPRSHLPLGSKPTWTRSSQTQGKEAPRVLEMGRRRHRGPAASGGASCVRRPEGPCRAEAEGWGAEASCGEPEPGTGRQMEHKLPPANT